MQFKDKKQVLGALLVSIMGISAGILYSDGGEPVSEVEDWEKVQLQNVESGENFTIAELDKPILLESFAVWCPTCTRQQKQIEKFHEGNPNVTSVSINTDPNEDAEKIRQHINRHGFDWRYAVSPPRLSRALADEFGNSILNPPSSPVVLVCENGSRILPANVKTASTLESEVSRGC